VELGFITHGARSPQLQGSKGVTSTTTLSGYEWHGVCFVFLRTGRITPTAIEAECVDGQGLFYETMKALYAMPDFFGVRPWESYAEEAGLPDLESFTVCIVLRADSFPRIAAGKEVGERHGVSGTPMIWVNGHRFNGRDLATLRKRGEELGIRN